MGRIHFISLALLLGFNSVAMAESSIKSSVRVLTWWGYINTKDPKVINIEKKCRTKLSLDEFYSNAEFLSRIENSHKNSGNFDILIYSDTVIKSAQMEFVGKLKNSLDVRSDKYEKTFRDFFDGRDYNSSTAAFQISLTGFLLNKKLINSSKTDPLSSFFKKSGDNIVVLLDDHVEIATLLNKWECTEQKTNCGRSGHSLFPDEEKLKRLVGKTKVVISSDLAEITKHPKFALAYTWSGGAVQKQAAQPNLEFLLHPSLSHTSMDLLTLVGTSPEAKCVANEMSAKDFVDTVAAKTKYFSPFGAVASQEPAFVKMQDEFFKQFGSFGRIHRVSQEESLEIDKKWQVFKILFGKKI